MVNSNTKTSNQVKTHKLRTFFAAICGIIAVYLILSSVTVIWLNRTITDTPTYVKTVAPLVKKPAIQNYIAQQVTTQLLNGQSAHDIATTLLPPSAISVMPSNDQIVALLKPVIQGGVLKIVQSPAFATLWIQTNQSAHTQLMNQINANSSQLQLDLSPTVNGVIAQLKLTKLSPIADKLNIKPDSGKININSNVIRRIHHYYQLFKTGTIAIALTAVIFLALSIWLSVHHMKTTRRILIGVGILALLQALLLEAPMFIKMGSADPVTIAAARAFVGAIFHNLLIASLIVGVICILVAIASKIYDNKKTKK